MITTLETRRRVRSGGQGGFTLVEAMVAMVILGLIFTGVVAMSTVSTASGSANRTERVDVLFSAFSEAIKILPYVPCAQAAEYQAAFDAAEAAAPSDRKLLQSSDASLTVVDVDIPSGCIDVDGGTQTVTLKAELGDQSRTSDMVKRDPAAKPVQLVALINKTQIGADGESVIAFDLTAIGSSPENDITTYDWTCGSTPPVSFQVFADDDGEVQCSYDAPAAGGSAVTKTIGLTVTDGEGRTASTQEIVTIQPQSPQPQGPTSAFTYSPASSIVTGQTVTFTSTATPPPGGQIDKWEWDFDDGTSVACVRPNVTCVTNSHVYSASKSSYTVRHWVTDQDGVRRASSQSVEVIDAALVRPTASFIFAPSVRLAPQRVSFDGSASRDANSNPVASYAWNFGDTQNNTASGPTPTHDYNLPGNYTVTLTVTASNTATRVITQVVTVGQLAPPANFRLISSTCYTNIFGLCVGGARFKFGWTNPQRPPGDTLKYKVELQRTTWCSYFFGTVAQQATAGSVGSDQELNVDASALSVCKGKYIYRVQVEKTSALGTTTSGWSTPVEIEL